MMNDSGLLPPKREVVRSMEDLLFMHPLMTSKVVLRTHSIEQLCVTVHRTTALRHPGLYFTGISGMGKTWALTFLESYLHTKWPALPIVVHNSKNNQAPSIRGFYKLYLASLKNKRTSGETADLVIRLTKSLSNLARESGLDMVLLLVDEAQNMKIQDFNFLKDVGNEMAKESTTLVTVLMAQEPEFSSVVTRIKDDRRMDILSRFVLRPNRFYGFRSVSDLEQLLEQIDSAIWEEVPDVTWTQFFIPEAYSSGYRLKSYASEMFAGLLTEKIDRSVEFPARQVFAAIREYLVDCSAVDATHMVFQEQIWAHAVSEAAIAEILRQNSSTD